MIIVDVEASGNNPRKHSIVSVGAVDFADRARVFYDECRIWDGAHIMNEALEVNGFTREEILDPSRKTVDEVVRAFIAWGLEADDQTIAGHNPSFDRDFLMYSAERSHTDWPFSFRTIDTHSICYAHMVQRGIEPPREKHHTALNLDKVLGYAGLPDEPKPHNALTGARMEAEALSRLLYNKPFYDEYREYPIPWGAS